ncbi:MAG: GNAT family N-acetyltransferase [Candidatus Omnitrophica bacterium]|nr:GNAT family N-acetyltransferase [Candidatus Omnitrophota bacterium]
MSQLLKIEGRHIYLRELTVEDVSQEYLHWMQDEEVLRFTESVGKVFNLDDLRKFVQEKLESNTDYFFGIFLLDTEKHIGNIKMGNIDQSKGQADIGIIIGNKSMWGKGYAQEAISLVSKFAFDELGLNKIIAGMIELNIGSYKAFLKAGFNESRRDIGDINFEGQQIDSIWMEKCQN